MRRKKKLTSIFEPTAYKVVLTFMLSLLSLYGWVILVYAKNLHFVSGIIYLGFTFMWLVISGIASSYFVYYSKKNRITKSVSYVIVGTISITIWTIAYSFLL